ncbi:hypothetical protein, partial [Pseudonocardia nigra]|uniref:hypothetical protein n=1 Tax=Pseudonocardia nigra TaxID=1921578 RepID=UPI001C5E49F8
MSARGRIAVLLVCAAVALLTAWYVGARSAPSGAGSDPVAVGSVRLGPEPGEAVDHYLARLPAELPPPQAQTLALVQFAAELPIADAVAATAGTTPVTAVFRVPLPRVQTALRFERLEPGVPPVTALTSARERAAAAAAGDATRATGRPGDVAA